MKGKARFLQAGALVWMLALMTGTTAIGNVTVDFTDLHLEDDSYWNGEDYSGGFESGDVHFFNEYEYDDVWQMAFWKGFSYSNIKDNTTPGHANQYAAFSGGAHAGDIYAVGYHSIAWGDSPEYQPRLTLAIPDEVLGLYVTNTTYAALYMRDGDAVFGVEPFQQGDYFALHISGYDVNDDQLGMTTIYLADFRSLIPEEHYVVSSWQHVDLSSFGSEVKSLRFSTESSDPFAPSYFALDSIVVVPEPGTALLSVIGCLVLCLLRKRRGLVSGKQ